MEREELIKQILLSSDPSPQELAKLCNDGSIFMRLIAKLLRDLRSEADNFVNVDLISDEGRLNAIKRQGIAQGRAQLVEGIIDLILEGQENDGSGKPDGD